MKHIGADSASLRPASPTLGHAVELWRAGKGQQAESACLGLIAQGIEELDARGLLAEILCARGEFVQAAEHLRHIADMRPRDAASQRRLGDAQFAAASFAAAADTFRHAIALDPRHPRGHNNLGRALACLGLRSAAIDSYRRAIALDPAYAFAHTNLGIALAAQGELAEAVASCERALASNPDIAEAHATLGDLLLRLERPQEALSVAERALQLRPGWAQAHLLRAAVLRRLHRLPEALESVERARSVAPTASEALALRASLLTQLERFDEAHACYDELISLLPDSAPFAWDRAMALTLDKRFGPAARGFARVLELNPDVSFCLGYLLHTSYFECDWTYAHRVSEGVHAVMQGKRSFAPFVILALTDSAAAQRECARQWVENQVPRRAPVWSGERWCNERIRIAYLSGDLRDHAVSILMAGVFERHDRSRFEVLAVSLRKPSTTPLGARVLRAFDAFIDVSRQSDLEVARLIHQMRVDIVVDLMGLTHGQRFGILAHRPAPLLVSYLGYPATTGADYLDYILADDFVIPPAARELYSEKVVYLPECFQANDDRRPAPARHPARRTARAELELPTEGCVFCSFNNPYKITPQVFDIWCRLLAATPASVLWLQGGSEAAQRNLRHSAATRGIAPSRLLFGNRVPYPEYLARLALADLYLDTYPFNGGTMASDALWAGLPVVTCSGEAFASRMAGSLLRTLGLRELLTDSLASYEQLALRLASDPVQLAAVRAKLATNRTSSALFDTARFCRHLESAYTTMVERWRDGRPADGFVVAAQPR